MDLHRELRADRLPGEIRLQIMKSHARFSVRMCLLSAFIVVACSPYDLEELTPVLATRENEKTELQRRNRNDEKMDASARIRAVGMRGVADTASGLVDLPAGLDPSLSYAHPPSSRDLVAESLTRWRLAVHVCDTHTQLHRSQQAGFTATRCTLFVCYSRS
jgi:hypothetical protein